MLKAFDLSTAETHRKTHLFKGKVCMQSSRSLLGCCSPHPARPLIERSLGLRIAKSPQQTCIKEPKYLFIIINTIFMFLNAETKTSKGRLFLSSGVCGAAEHISSCCLQGGKEANPICP